MAEVTISSSSASDLSNKVDEYSVAALSTDGPTSQEETEWTNPKWTVYWGYFNSIPELKSAILMKALWVVGKGYETDTITKLRLEKMRGWGKDSFDDIIFNMKVISMVGGDAFAEIMRDDGGRLMNLKPLDPGSMRIVVDRKGMIKRYEQFNKLDKEGKAVSKFKPSEILHISNNRLADQIHGISDIEAIEEVIKADQENFNDMKTIMHRQARPMIMFKLGTDDATTISNFVGKMDSATNKGENIYIPDDENAVSWEVVQVNVSSIIMAWRDDLKNKFYRSVGLPQIVPGGTGGTTESESKVIYLAFEQIVEKEQRFLEKQLWNQLAIKIDFIAPPTLSTELTADGKKDSGQAFQPNDTTAGRGR